MRVRSETDQGTRKDSLSTASEMAEATFWEAYLAGVPCYVKQVDLGFYWTTFPCAKVDNTYYWRNP